MNLLLERDPVETADIGDPFIADNGRRIARMLRIGSVSEVDYTRARVRILFGGTLKTGWIPWLTERAHNDISWWAPEVNEQVMVFSPRGDFRQGVVLGAIFQNAYPAPANRETLRITKYADGTIVQYDRAAHRLLVNCVGEVDIDAATKAVVQADEVDVLAAENVKIQAAQISIIGPVSIQGNVSIQGTVSATGTILDATGNTNHHVHP